MKKATLTTIYSALLDFGYESTDPVMEEIAKELNKGAEKAQANRDLYDQAKEIVLGELGETPATIGELYAAVADKLPEGFTKAKVQYAMTHYWSDEVVKHEGKVNSYTRA